MPRILSIILLLFALLPVPVTAATSPSARETKRVLILYSQEKGHPAHDLTDQGIRAGFVANPGIDVKLYTEYLDTGRFSIPAHASLTADYLRRKYAGLNFDAIIAVYPAAMDFLLAERRSLFPGVPVVVCETTRSAVEKLEQSPERSFITGVILGDNATEVITSALRLKPDTRHIALIAGTTPNDAYSEQILRRGLKPVMGKLDLIDLTKLSMEETLSRVSSLPPQTIILYSSIFIDGAGKNFVPREALSLIARAANAPVFGLYETFFGQGIVGGSLISFNLQGKTAAELALRVMAGESPASIPFGGEEAYVNAYDWRELKRWKIPVAAIPAGAEIRFRQLTIWEQYRWYVIGAVSLTIIETALIFGLVINLKRRRKAELELAESRMRLDLAADSAGAGLWSIDAATGRIWATDRALELYGFSPGDVVDLEMILSVVNPEDREGLVQAIEQANRDNKAFIVEYRITLPDGSRRWMTSRGSSQHDGRGETISLRGATVDISERKQMEESLRDSEQNLRSLTGRLITAQEEERSRIARELHDDVTQRLAVLAIEMGKLEIQSASAHQQHKDQLGAMKNDIVKLSEDVHAISRKLHPSILDDLGLVRAIQSESASFSRLKGVEVTFRHEAIPEMLPRDISLALYRIVQEGFSNIAKHSEAKSVQVTVSCADNAIQLSIRDSGIGFDPQQVENKVGLGLVSMAERVKLVQGTISVDSIPGLGTVIDVRVPFVSDAVSSQD